MHVKYTGQVRVSILPVAVSRFGASGAGPLLPEPGELPPHPRPSRGPGTGESGGEAVHSCGQGHGGREVSPPRGQAGEEDLQAVRQAGASGE